jgi:hypothetical protein
MPTFTGLTSQESLANGKKGLHTVRNRTSEVDVTGTGLSNGLAMTIWLGGTKDDPDIRWTGRLRAVNQQQTVASCQLTTSINKYEPPTGTNMGSGTGTGLGEGEDVSVTLGEGPAETPPVAIQVNMDP